MLYNNLFNFLEESMKKATKPLLAGGLKTKDGAQSNKDALIERGEKATSRYPFHEISPHLDIKISPRAKRMALRLETKDRTIKLVIPKRASINSAYEFALEHADWIKKSIADLPTQIGFTHGTVIPVLGKDRTININHDSTLKRTNISLNNNEILVSTNKEDASSRIKRFLINTAKKELTTLAHEKAERIDKTIQKVDVKDTVSRWGSCSHDGKISFSWRLIFAPIESLDYVVAHEVAHLAHLDHSPAFWKVCEALSDQYGKGSRWMRKNSAELMRYGA
jgi:predicted metal-dependent hydrolase